MSNRNKEEIAGVVRNTLITEYGYKVEGDYVRTPISNNYGLGFYHSSDKPLCLCVYHHEDAQFSPRQRSKIFEVLGREEFTASYTEAEESEDADEKPEIWASLKTNAFDGWKNEDIADWVVQLFDHFITTVNLLEVT